MEITSNEAASAGSPFNPLAGVGDAATLGKDDFLTLLVTQLANQDPMNPTDSTEFTAQLAQFSSLEQLQNLNTGLEILALAQTAGTSAEVIGFVGQEVQYAADVVTWEDDQSSAEMQFELGSSAQTVTVTVRDEDGAIVKTIEGGAMGDGSQSVTLDGTDDDGKPLDEGRYTFSVEAKDAEGEDVSVTTRSKGVVESVSFENGYPELVLDTGETIALGDIISAGEPGAESTVVATRTPDETTRTPDEDE